MSWDQDTTLELIFEYKSRPNLWKPKHKCPYTTLTKEDLWREISDKLNISTDDVRKKMDSLRGSFRREKSRVKAKADGPDKYISKWFAFGAMSFLEIKNRPRRTMSRMRTESSSDEEQEENEAIRSAQDDNDPVNENTSLATVDIAVNDLLESFTQTYTKTQCNSSIKSETKRQSNVEVPRVVDVSTAKEVEDECSTFGDHVANKLRKFNDKMRAIAQHRIGNVLFDLEMMHYNNPTS